MSLENDIREADKLVNAIIKARQIFRDLKLGKGVDPEISERANAIHWALIMFGNDAFEMIRDWKAELGKQEAEQQPSKPF